jgi:hypothetical protein
MRRNFEALVRGEREFVCVAQLVMSATKANANASLKSWDICESAGNSD